MLAAVLIIMKYMWLMSYSVLNCVCIYIYIYIYIYKFLFIKATFLVKNCWGTSSDTRTTV